VLRVVSWNVLADAYIQPQYFPFSDVRHLDPAWRRSALLDRFVTADADVLCLQEIEPALFEAAKERLTTHEGRYLAKIGRPDGVAIFVKADRRPSDWREIIYRDGTGHGALSVRAVVPHGVKIGIATTHLKWQKPEVPAAERLSIGQLSELLDAFVRDGEAWIVTGDLNADATSVTLKVAFARGFVDPYAATPNAYTSNANAKAKRIDFLLHTEQLRARTTLPPTIDDRTPLPSEREPSDHLAIAADFFL